jgi:copper transport protein
MRAFRIGRVAPLSGWKWLRILALVAMAVAAVVIPAGPASAHAALLENTPSSGSVVQTAPEQIRLHFSEGISIKLGGIRVFGPAGQEIELPKPTLSDGSSTITVPFEAAEQGTYTVAWRVISGDSHPISSAFTFSIGKDTMSSMGKGGGAHNHANMAGAFGVSSGNRTVGVLFGVARFAAFTGLVLLVGGFAFLWLVWPSGTRSPIARRLLLGAWATSFLASGAALLLQAPYASGGGLGDAFDGGASPDEFFEDEVATALEEEGL